MSHKTIYLGKDGLDFTDVDKLSSNNIPVNEDLSNYLSEIEYKVDIKLKKSSLGKILGDLGIAYAIGGSTNDFDDFEQLVNNGDLLEDRKARTYQEKAGKSFDLNRGFELLGRMPATLTSSAFTSHTNPGADSITVANEAYEVDDIHSNAVPRYVFTNPVTGVASYHEFADLETSYSADNSDVYDDKNVVSSCLARALSSQMLGFGNDQNLLRLVAQNKNYINLLTFGLHGSTNQTNGVQRLQDMLASKDSSAEESHTVKDLIAGLFTENTTNDRPNSKPLGHSLLAAIFNFEPPSPTNFNTDNTQVDKLWTHKDLDGDANKDILKLANTAHLEYDYKLQFVLQTSLNLKAGLVTVNSAQASPGTGDHPANKVEVLFNLIFDRTGEVELTQGVEIGPNTRVTMSDNAAINA